MCLLPLVPRTFFKSSLGHLRGLVKGKGGAPGMVYLCTKRESLHDRHISTRSGFRNHVFHRNALFGLPVVLSF